MQNSVAYAVKLFCTIILSTCMPLATLISALPVIAGQHWAGRLLGAVFSRHMKININVWHPVPAVNHFRKPTWCNLLMKAFKLEALYFSEPVLEDHKK